MNTTFNSISQASRDPALQFSESRFLELKESYENVCKSISSEAKAHSRGEDSITLVAVSKYMPASDIQVLYDLGHRHFGENYVQELIQKAEIVSMKMIVDFRHTTDTTIASSRYQMAFHWLSSNK